MERLTVRELVDEANLGLVLVSGQPGLDRVIEGIHLSDLEDPTPWMTSGMVLVTTGETFASSAAKGTRLLERLDAIQAVALVVGVGHYLESVPPEIVARAQALRIPVFEAPLSVPFRTIVKYVYNALASSDMHRLRRSLAVQSHLLELLVEERDVSDILTSLANLIEMPLVLFDASGEVVAASSVRHAQRADAQRLWAEYRRSGKEIGPLGVLEVGNERFYYRSITVYGTVRRVLAGCAPQAPPSEFVETALSFAQRLLTLDLLRSSEQLMLRRRMRAHVLDDFLQARSRGDDARRRLLEEHIAVDEGWRLVTCSVRGTSDDGPGTGERETYAFRTRLLNVVDGFFGQRPIPFLSMVRGDVCLVMTAFEESDTRSVRNDLERLRDTVGEQFGGTVAVGCSSETHGVDGPGIAVRQAEEALRRAATAGSPCLHDELSRGLRLIDDQPSERLQAIAMSLVEPLRLYDAEHRTYLLTTLKALFDNGLSANQTAATLFVHRNTLRKRLRRIEAVLGVDLTDMDDIAELYLALRADVLLGSHA